MLAGEGEGGRGVKEITKQTVKACNSLTSVEMNSVAPDAIGAEETRVDNLINMSAMFTLFQIAEPQSVSYLEGHVPSRDGA